MGLKFLRPQLPTSCHKAFPKGSRHWTRHFFFSREHVPYTLGRVSSQRTRFFARKLFLELLTVGSRPFLHTQPRATKSPPPKKKKKITVGSEDVALCHGYSARSSLSRVSFFFFFFFPFFLGDRTVPKRFLQALTIKPCMSFPRIRRSFVAQCARHLNGN